MPRKTSNEGFFLPPTKRARLTAALIAALIGVLWLPTSRAHADAHGVLAARIAFVKAKIANRRAQQEKINLQYRLRNDFKKSPEVNTTMEQFRWATKQRAGERDRIESNLTRFSQNYRQAHISFIRARTTAHLTSMDPHSDHRDVLETAQAMIDRDTIINKMTRAKLEIDPKYIEAHEAVLFYIRKLVALKREFEEALPSHPQIVEAARKLEQARENLKQVKHGILYGNRGGNFRFGNREAPGLPRRPR